MPSYTEQSSIVPLLSKLSSEAARLLREVATVAEQQGVSLYLAGGPVRDLLLKRSSLDLDFVVEGDAIAFAESLSDRFKAALTTHTAFNTATLQMGGLELDFAMARTETYEQPGVLPRVAPAGIREDLKRRDFTINALAASLNQATFGQVLDPFEGRQDLDRKVVRILHDESFRDDATRIWRAVRYAARFGFALESRTQALLRRDRRWLSSISGDRVRNEFLRILAEEQAAQALTAAHREGLLAPLDLAWDPRTAARFVRARELGHVRTEIYIGLLGCSMTQRDCERFTKVLALPGQLSRPLLQAQQLTGQAQRLTSSLSASAIYAMLREYDEAALLAVQLNFEGMPAAEQIERYLRELRHIKPALDGRQVLALGVPEGPAVGEALELLRKARLDGKVADVAQEEALVKGWLAARTDAS